MFFRVCCGILIAQRYSSEAESHTFRRILLTCRWAPKAEHVSLWRNLVWLVPLPPLIGSGEIFPVLGTLPASLHVCMFKSSRVHLALRSNLLVYHIRRQQI